MEADEPAPDEAKLPPVEFDDDNPEWTEEDFARARPITDFPELAAVLAAWPKKPRRA